MLLPKTKHTKLLKMDTIKLEGREYVRFSCGHCEEGGAICLIEVGKENKHLKESLHGSMLPLPKI